MKNIKPTIIIEYAWLAMAIFCFSISLYYHWKYNFNYIWLIYILSLISLGMFFVRRIARLSQERNEKHHNK